MCKKTVFFWSIVAMLIVAGSAFSVLPKALLPWADGFESGDFTDGGWSVHEGDVIVSDRAKCVGKYGAELSKTARIEKAVSTAGFGDIHVKHNPNRYTEPAIKSVEAVKTPTLKSSFLPAKTTLTRHFLAVPLISTSSMQEYSSASSALVRNLSLNLALLSAPEPQTLSWRPSS